MNEDVLLEARKMISGFLAQRRKELGISQRELAEQSGMGQATIERFECGHFWIGLRNYLILCHYLKCYPFLASHDGDHPMAVMMREEMGKAQMGKREGDEN